MGSDLQSMLFKAMTDPGFYPHPVTELSQQETHISKVFLTGPYVYKIKKPVDFGFVDFSALANRRLYCEQEVLLNKRLTDDIYLGVIPIGYDGRHFGLDASGETVEYAVKMRQLPASGTMCDLLAADRIRAHHLSRLAARLAAFHQNTRRVTDPGARSYAQAACTENFRQIMPHAGELLDAGRYDFIRAATFNFFIRNKDLLDKRIAHGYFREGHGDLRTEHVYFTPDGRIQVLDCIEFNERLRVTDIVSDLAFLIMDLEFRRKKQIARDLLRAYLQLCDDPGLLSLMDFFKCYRAMVRCKVNCLQLKSHGRGTRRSNDLAADAQCYLNLAYYYARRFGRPTIWIFCGLPGSGKSTLANRLADILAMKKYNSDSVRKALQGLAPLTHVDAPVDEGLYAPEISRQVYDRLYAQAHNAVREGRSLILDATYSALSNRNKLRAMADDCGARIIFVECLAGQDDLERRLERRSATPSVSDARLAHFGILKSRFEPLAEIPASQHIKVETTKPEDHCLKDLMNRAYLDDPEDCLPPQPEDRPGARPINAPVTQTPTLQLGGKDGAGRLF